MKIDLPNLLYIVAIVVWVIVGFIRKNKKAKGSRPTTTMPPVGEPQQPEFGDILEEILGKKREEKKPQPVAVPASQPQHKKTPFTAKQPKTLETISGTDSAQRSIPKNYKQHTGITHPPKPQKSAAQKPQQESPLNAQQDSEFDLRQAVIYSEILNPPYKEE